MDPFNAELSRVLKYKRERLPVSAIHPELRFTRLGAVLREHATEGGDVGELAYQALTSPHDQPLELMPLHLLRDKMQEEPDYPLANKVVWSKLPERVSHNQRVRGYFGKMSNGLMIAAAGHWGGYRHNLEKFLKDNPDMTENDIRNAASRLLSQNSESRVNDSLPADRSSDYAEYQHTALANRKFVPFSAEHYGPPE